jgi:hypothetical protein
MMTAALMAGGGATAGGLAGIAAKMHGASADSPPSATNEIMKHAQSREHTRTPDEVNSENSSAEC